MTITKDFDIKRNEIMDCAKKLFISRGYELTTVNAILKEVGIAKGTFYYYFNSKEEVMDAVIMKIVQQDLHYAKQILVDKDKTAFEKLVNALFSKPKSSDKENMIEQLYEANNALMKQRALQRTIEMICPIYAQIIEEGNLKKEFSSKYPLADIQFLIAGIQSIYDLAKVENSSIKIDFEAVLEIMYKVLSIDESKISKEQAKMMITKNM